MILELALKTGGVLVLAAVLARLCYRASAAVRHLIWLSALAGLLIMPVAGRLASWDLRVLPADGVSVDRVVGGAGSGPASRESEPCCSLTKPSAVQPNWSPEDLLRRVWLLGVLVCLARMGAGLWRVRRLAVDSVELEPPVRRSLAAKPRTAIAFGIWKPVVLLPSESIDWSASRRQMVVLHELAHLRRHDFVSNLIAELACAIYWFNPLVWLGARAMRAEAESAADDSVLGNGIRASDYASELLRMAAEIGKLPGRPALSGASSMIQNRIESRLERILSSSARRRGLTLLPTLGLCIGMLAFTAIVAGARLAAQESASQTSAAPTLSGQGSADRKGGVG